MVYNVSEGSGITGAAVAKTGTALSQRKLAKNGPTGPGI